MKDITHLIQTTKLNRKMHLNLITATTLLATVASAAPLNGSDTTAHEATQFSLIVWSTLCSMKILPYADEALVWSSIAPLWQIRWRHHIDGQCDQQVLSFQGAH